MTRNALAHGRRGALLTVAGLAGGVAGWVAVTSLGIAALLAATTAVYSVLKVAGGSYLLYLGLTTIWHSRRPPETAELIAPPQPLRPRSLWRQGFLSAMLNPKLGVFFVALFPAFTDPGSPQGRSSSCSAASSW